MSNVSARELVIFTAKKIVTMDDTLPEATAVAVSEGKVLAVGTLEDMAVWTHDRQVRIDRSFEDQVLMPGMIDNHIHPFLGALLLPMVILAPEAWRGADGQLRPEVRDPERYKERLLQEFKARDPSKPWFITWGYQPDLHGRYDRDMLDALFPDTPVILWQRSFHETYLNTAAIQQLGLQAEDWQDHPQIDWKRGHFFETGFKPILMGLLPYFLRPEWYGEGLKQMVALMRMGGITTAGDMLFGAISPEYELAALHKALPEGASPLRVVNVFDLRSFSNRASGAELGPPDQAIAFDLGLEAIEKMWADGPQGHVWFARGIKLFADGAIFSQLMKMRWPGYLDGHEGEWLMTPEILKAGVLEAFKRDWTVHVHVNGDGGMEAVLDALKEAQRQSPRFDHRFHVHHVGYHAQAQTSQLAALGAHASVNPYYLHALGDDYAQVGLGPERATQLVRCGSMVREGMRVSLHSDFMMAPAEPLSLAWCAASRQTRTGKIMSPSERLTLQQALRAVTIDAAWALRLDEEIGSISVGKRADFAVLDADPFERGVDGLLDVRVMATIFEGQVHANPHPSPSSLAASRAASHVASTSSPQASPSAVEASSAKRWRLVGGHCNGISDRCDLVRTWSQWLHKALIASSVPPSVLKNG
jgi:predicted amidohydrolase YtcJ